MTSKEAVGGEEENEKVEGPTEWMSRAMRQHPDVLALKERLRPIQKPTTPSFGRDHRKAARTEVHEVLSPITVFQLILQYLHEEGLIQTRDALLQEAKTLCPELLDSLQLSSATPSSSTSGTSGSGSGSKDNKDKEKESNSNNEGGGDEGFSDATLDPIYQHSLIPLLRLGIKDLTGLFANMGLDAGESDQIDPEVEQSESYPGELDIEEDEDEDEKTDINIWDEEPQEGTNSLFKQGQTPELIAGTLNQIISWLTDPLNQDRSFMLTFFLCYPAFMTSEKLVAKLVQRYHKPAGLSDSFQEQCVLALTALRTWVEKYPLDFVGPVYDAITHFTRTNSEKETSVQFKQLTAAVTRLDEIDRTHSTATTTDIRDDGDDDDDENFPRPQVQTEAPQIPKNIFSPKLTLDDIEEMEIAKQMCLIDFKHYWRIRPRELVACMWKKEPSKAPTVVSALKRSTELSKWATYCIIQGKWAPTANQQQQLSLSQAQQQQQQQQQQQTSLTSSAGVPNPQHSQSDRPRMLGKFTRVAYWLYKNNNFFASWAIYNAISSTSVQRAMRASGANSSSGTSTASLNQSRRGGMPLNASFIPDNASMLTELSMLFSSDNNFAQYRKTCRQTRSACVPDLLVHLRDLIVVEEGMPAKLNGTLINVYKYNCIARLINDFLSHKEVVYPLQQVDQITALLKDWNLPDEKSLQDLAANAQRE